MCQHAQRVDDSQASSFGFDAGIPVVKQEVRNNFLGEGDRFLLSPVPVYFRFERVTGHSNFEPGWNPTEPSADDIGRAVVS